MFNYVFMLPSFMVLVVILAYYFAMPRLPIRMNRVFLTELTLEMLVVVFDYYASLACEAYDVLPAWVLWVLNMAFFVFFLARAFWFYLFTRAILPGGAVRRKRDRLVRGAVFLASEVVALSSFLTRAVFWIDETGYHSGPMYNIVYVCFFYYLFASLALLIVNRGKLSRFDYHSAMAFNLVLVFGNVCRILMPKVLIMNTFCLLALLIIYLSFENHDLYLSERGAIFNMRAFRSMLGERTEVGDFCVLGVAIRNYIDTREIYGSDLMDKGTDVIGHHLMQYNMKYGTFYLRNGRFVLVGDKDMPWQDYQRRLSERFRRPWQLGDTELSFDVTFVHVGADSKLNTTERILNNLLRAMSESDGRVTNDQPVIDLDFIEDIDREVEVRRALELALNRNTVEVFLQPIMDSATFELSGAEALARLRGADGKLISPGEFIPIAEKNGHIALMGEQVFEKVCAFVRDHDMEALGLKWVNVNLSPIQCMRSDLCTRFQNIIKAYGVDPDFIHLEITEQTMVDYAVLQSQLSSLKASGFQFSLDDFGAGYSNLTRVNHYPFKNIKIDMDVVRDYFKERESLLPALVRSFREMDLTVTAEGIETCEMAELLTSIGCNYLQGFYFSKPLPMDEFLEKYGGG